MRLLAIFLLFMISTNILFVNIHTVVSDQMELELLEEVPADAENELEDESKFHISSTSSNPYILPSILLQSLQFLEISDRSTYDVSTPPPEA